MEQSWKGVTEVMEVAEVVEGMERIPRVLGPVDLSFHMALSSPILLAFFLYTINDSLFESHDLRSQYIMNLVSLVQPAKP